MCAYVQLKFTAAMMCEDETDEILYIRKGHI